MTYRTRRTAKAARLRQWAAKREAKSVTGFARAAAIANMIPLGQPILCGHASEAHARRDQARIVAGMSAGVEHARKAEEMTRRANGIERQADHAIYSDDADAHERLRERIAELEAKLARMKAINAEIRKGPGWAERLTLTYAEEEDLRMAARYSHVMGYPPYALSNLSGNLRRQRERLVEMGKGWAS